MKLLGFITGVVLIVGLGAWYTQEEASLSWPPLTETPAPPSAPELDSIGLEDAPDNLPAPEISPPLSIPQASEPEHPAPTLPLAKPAGAPNAPDNTADSPSWQAFWEPFRTASSARGFARRLRETTGLEIKVDKNSAHEYWVLFPYTSEEERQQRIALIENRTSLKLLLADPP